MQKLFVEFSHTVNNNEFKFFCVPNTQLSDAKEALFLLLKDLGQIEDNYKLQQEQQLKEKQEQTTEETQA